MGILNQSAKLYCKNYNKGNGEVKMKDGTKHSMTRILIAQISKVDL
jgi:hypothetical protein